jgi:hypothetical protein
MTTTLEGFLRRLSCDKTIKRRRLTQSVVLNKAAKHLMVFSVAAITINR